MCEAAHAGGAEPVVFHGLGVGPGRGARRQVGRYDGIPMPGGADVGPGTLRPGASPTTLAVVPPAGRLDIAVTEAVIESGQPMLTIWPGDADPQRRVRRHPRPGPRRDDRAAPQPPHDVATVEGSRPRKVTGADTLTVSSYHHQCVDRLGEGLTVTGTAADDVVEAVEHDTADILAVQWHPEDPSRAARPTSRSSRTSPSAPVGLPRERPSP